MTEQGDISVTEIQPSRQVNPFTPEEVGAVNQLLGIGNLEQLEEKHYPPTLNLSKWWKAAGPIVSKKPKDREVSIGWSLREGKLKIDEVVDGTPFNEIEQKGKKALGMIIVGTVKIEKHHLITFHTHPEKVEEIQKIAEKQLKSKSSEVKRSVRDVPESNFHDISIFLYSPESYVDIICDVSVREKGQIPVFVAIKTKETPVITADNSWKYTKKVNDIIFTDILVGSEKHSYSDFLEHDLEWQKNFGVVVYRGYLSENTNEPQIVRKSDIRLRKSSKEYMGHKGLLTRLHELISVK